MDDRLRILITGFGPFPGAPFNPTMQLVERLMQLRRPAFDDVELSSHIFHVTYATVDRELPQLLEETPAACAVDVRPRRPDVLLRVETRARNAVTTIFPDADGTRVGKGSIAADADAMMFGPHTAKLLRVALSTGIDARASRDAGAYLCNYLSWRAIEATQQDKGPQLAAFIHIPLLAHDGAARAPGGVTLEALVDAGEAMLLELMKLTRNACVNRPVPDGLLTLPPTIPLFAAGVSPREVAFLRYFLSSRYSREDGHGLQSPPSHWSFCRRRRGRARRLAGGRARGATHLRTRSRRHAIWRAARQSRRPDPRPAARDRRGRARCRAAGAAARHLSHRRAAPRQRHATHRRARRDQARVQRRRRDVARRRRGPCDIQRPHARRWQPPAAGAARPDLLPRRPRHSHHRLRDH